MSGLGKLDFPKFTKEFILPGTTAATSANYGTFYIADRPCVVEGFSFRAETDSSAAETVQLRKVAAGTTIAAAGTASNILAAGVALNGGDCLVVNGTPVQNTELNVGDALAVVPSGTPTAMVNAQFRVKLKYTAGQ